MTIFIAEVSSNHNRDFKRCFNFIEKSAEIGCKVIKFQLFKLNKLFTPEAIKRNKEVNKRINWELPIEFLPKISKTCKKFGIQFACSPFYLQAIDELEPYVDIYKIASYDILRHDLLRACAKTQKPVVLSTGMATIEEIGKAMDVLKNADAKDVTLLHCVSSYPTPPEECNLAVIETLRNRYHCKVGWSDHSVSPSVIYRAVYKWGASMIEFHLDLDKKGDEFKTGHCWLPDKIASVINNTREGLGREDNFTLADGSGKKKPVQSELVERLWRADPSDGLRPLLKLRKKWQMQK